MRMHVTRSRAWSHRIGAVVLSVAAATGVSSCSSDAPANSPTTQASGQHLAASDFSTALKVPGTIVLDVRTPTEFASGHLPEALNIDIGAPDFATRLAELDKNASYAVYCKSGNRSGVAMEQMTAAGIRHAYDLAGGIGAWQDMGGPVVMGGP